MEKRDGYRGPACPVGSGRHAATCKSPDRPPPFCFMHSRGVTPSPQPPKSPPPPVPRIPVISRSAVEPTHVIDQRPLTINRDYGGNPGIPPCRRCVREQKECVLATSRRGGRRPRKCVRLPDSDSTGAAPFPPGTTSTFDSVPAEGAASSEQPPGADQKSSETNRPWSCSPEAETPEAETPGRAASWPGSGSQPNSPGGRSLQSAGDIEGHITSSDLLNPSDALNLLAQVADLDGDGGTERNRKPSGSTTHEDGTPRDHPSSKTLATYHYPPISDGVLSLSVASRLLATYYEHYHPFFPVAHNCILSPPSIPFLTDSEPHLVTAIFTVVSKDEPSLSAVHEACSRHMETLISKLIYKGSTTVGAVEALLILAQWAPQRLQEKPTVGRGEEDEGAWMQIGVAIRLGYLQSLEQTGLLVDKQSALSEQFRRKRLVWAGMFAPCLIAPIFPEITDTCSLLHERPRGVHPRRQGLLVPRPGPVDDPPLRRLSLAARPAGRAG